MVARRGKLAGLKGVIDWGCRKSGRGQVGFGAGEKDLESRTGPAKKRVATESEESLNIRNPGPFPIAVAKVV